MKIGKMCHVKFDETVNRSDVGFEGVVKILSAIKDIKDDIEYDTEIIAILKNSYDKDIINVGNTIFILDSEIIKEVTKEEYPEYFL